jgi:hypothetical protein
LFDHDRTSFKLTGHHRDTACTGCHAILTDPATPELEQYLEFTVASFRRCSDCHPDPHEGRLGASCERCHGTSGWQRLEGAEFDHDKTRFRLEGKHRALVCESCHPPGRPSRVDRFELCSDCHQDNHLGQFAGRSSGGDEGDSCHSVARFSPSTFTLDLHRESDYPLTGAHLAVPCLECHKPTPIGDLRTITDQVVRRLRSEVVETLRFVFDTTRCLDCHLDPHAGEVDVLVSQGGCETCHAVASWHLVAFNHDLTQFPLEGKHDRVECNACHKTVDSGTDRERIRMVGASRLCADCHRDPHLGQFNRADVPLGCESCHGVDDWKTLVFDHNRDSRYALEGAHSRVSCAKCHPAELQEGRSMIRYKPLPTHCRGCHAGEALP